MDFFLILHVILPGHQLWSRLCRKINSCASINENNTTNINQCVFILLIQSFAFVSAQSISSVHVHCTKNALLSPKQLEFLHTNYGHPIILATDITENNV